MSHLHARRSLRTEGFFCARVILRCDGTRLPQSCLPAPRAFGDWATGTSCEPDPWLDARCQTASITSNESAFSRFSAVAGVADQCLKI